MLTLSSCAQDKEKIVAEKIEERVSAFRAKKTEECREHLLQLAERIADSLLLADAQSALNDSLSRLRPLRPYEPAAIPPIDSLTVQPIFSAPLPASSSNR
jgi:hypothetical protein